LLAILRAQIFDPDILIFDSESVAIGRGIVVIEAHLDRVRVALLHFLDLNRLICIIVDKIWGKRRAIF
jgi:hypothetical protein